MAWRHPCGRIYARFTPTWTGYTRRTRISSPTPGKLDGDVQQEMLELATLRARCYNRTVEDGEEIQRVNLEVLSSFSGIPAQW